MNISVTVMSHVLIQVQALSALSPGGLIISGSVVSADRSFFWSLMMVTLNSAEDGNSLMNTLPGSDDERRK